MSLIIGQAATYYVATNGNDSADGSSGTPWLTVQKGLNTVVAGDTLKINQGVYLENTSTLNNGSNGLPITVDGQNVATLGSIALLDPYWNIQNLTFANGTNVFGGQIYVAQAASYCVVSNNLFDPNFTVGITPLIKWNGPSSLPYGTAGSGNLIISNVFQNTKSEMVLRVYGDTNRIQGNTFLNGNETDFIQVFGRSNYISGNTISNIFSDGTYSNHADVIQSFGVNAGSQGHIFEDNTIMNCHYLTQIGNFVKGIGGYECRDIMFRNNLFLGVSAKVSVAIEDVTFYNNVFYNCATNLENGGPVITVSDSGTTGQGHGFRAYNNVFLDCGYPGATNAGGYSVDTTLTNVSADYNYISKLGFNPVQPDSMSRPIGDAGGWDKFLWWENNGINGGNPFVTSARRFNMHPLVTSLLINAGTNLSGLFTDDINGVTRDANWDIGPYEYVEVPPAELACITDPKASRAYPVSNTNWIGIVWPTNQYRIYSTISRRVYTNNPSYWNDWVSIYTNSADTTMEGMFADSDVTNGIHYEYAFSQLITNWVCSGVTNGPAWTYQYLSAGTFVPLKDERGNVVILTDSTLTNDFSTLTNNLIGDGYKVFRHDVSPDEVTNATWYAGVTNVRALVQSDFLTDTNADWTLLIVGHVPIPYAGLTSPGSHLDNFGAHPADWYYADRNTNGWHDIAANDSTADDPPQWNVPGDGKFDTNYIPNMVQMRVGRIDINQFPSTGKTSQDLMNQYLTRNNSWRHKEFTTQQKGAINFSNSSPANAHGLLSSFFGTTEQTILTNWLNYVTNTENSTLFAYASGSGTYDRDYQLGYTTNLLQNDFYAAFVRVFGSYYGDWDSGIRSNLFLLAPLAAEGYALTVEYGENSITMDHTSIGEPIGQQMFSMANNFFQASAKRYIQPFNLNLNVERVHQYVSLQGDPTLRAYVVVPPSGLSAIASGSDNILTWTDSTDSNVQGYHIYRAPSTNLNDFTRLTSSPDSSPYTDTGASGTAYTYMVRTIKLEDSDQRSFYNASQGVMVTASAQSQGTPTTTIRLNRGKGPRKLFR